MVMAMVPLLRRAIILPLAIMFTWACEPDAEPIRLVQGPPPAPVPERVPTSPTGGARGPYPILLHHGFSGFRSIGPIAYFYGVAEALRRDGHRVYVSEVAPYQISEVRGAQLARFITDVVLPESGAARVNIIGHSQGGVDARFAAHKLGGRVAAVVSIASPHRGSEVADIALGDRPGPLQMAVAALLDLLGARHGESDALAAMHALSGKGMEAFNGRTPDHPEVAYFSIAGRSAKSRGDGLCNPATQPAFIARWDRYVDPLGAELWLPGRIIEGSVTPGRPHDGLVSVESARWGTFLGCIPADHLGEVCQLLGAPRGGGNAFDCLAFYRDLASWLVERGY